VYSLVSNIIAVKNEQPNTMIAKKVLTTWLEIASILRQQKYAKEINFYSMHWFHAIV
jgi:hypothetical protein